VSQVSKNTQGAEQTATDINAYKIARKDLIDGAYYKGHCRNAQVARWSEADGCFYHWRTKFRSTFLEEIKHPEDEQFYDVFIVEELITDMTGVKEIPMGYKKLEQARQQNLELKRDLKEAMELLRRTAEDGWKCADQVDAFFARVKI
jgi:hypothetical protein